jgi:hypothetical protein
VSTRRSRTPPPPAPAEDEEDTLPVRLVPPATAAEETEAWQRLAAALAWLARQRMDA